MSPKEQPLGPHITAPQSWCSRPRKKSRIKEGECLRGTRGVTWARDGSLAISSLGLPGLPRPQKTTQGGESCPSVPGDPEAVPWPWHSARTSLEMLHQPQGAGSRTPQSFRKESIFAFSVEAKGLQTKERGRAQGGPPQSKTRFPTCLEPGARPFPLGASVSPAVQRGT